MTSVRDLIRSAQAEIRSTSDLQPDRAAELLMQLTALIGNCSDEIRAADAEYAVTLLHCLDTEAKANRARIRAEISPEYRRRQEARNAKELAVELCRSLKFFLKAKSDELQLARHQ
jgi:hypothetical protein